MKYTILYVDDERDLLDLGKLFLEQTPDFRVDIAASAKEALASLAFSSYDAIISDYQMPEMDGIAFLKAVRERFGDVPFILFTGRGREEVVIEAINNGVDFYLQKGGDVRAQFAELSHKIRQAVARNQAEHFLRESEKRLSDIIEFLPDATFAINRDGVIIAWNRAIEEMTGFSAETMLGKGDNEYALPFYGERRPILVDLVFEPDELIEQKYSHIVRNKGTLTAETNVPRLQGREVTLAGKASPLYNSQGEAIGAIEAIRDITEKKKAEDELRAAYEQITASQEELQGQFDELALSEQRIRESEEKFRTFMETSIDGVMLIDVTGSILTWNLAQEKIFGISAREAIGSNIIDIQERLIVPEHKTPAYIEGLRSQFTTSFPELFSRKAPLILEMEVMNVRGHRITIQQTLFPIQTSSGKRIGCISREVTEQRNAEKNLRESEAKYRELAELLPQMVFEMDLDFRVTYANQIALTTMGVADKDLEAGVSALSFLDPSDHERIRQNIEKIFRGETVANHEYTAVRRDGSTYPVMIYAAPFSRLGKPAGFRGIIIDITGQKEAEEELKESEERFRTLADAALEGIMIHDRGVIRDCNPQFAKMFGYTPEEIIGRNGFEFMMTAESRDAISRWIQNGAKGTIDVTGIKKDGTRFYGETASTFILLQGKQHTIVQMHDITARKESEQTLNLTIESAHLGIWDVNLVTHKQVHNRLWIEMLGYSTEEIDKPFDWWQEHIHPDDLPGVIESIENHVTGRAPYFDALYRMKHRDGSWRWIDTRGNVISRDSQGQPIRMIGINQDITRRKQAEDELRKSEERFREIVSLAREGIWILDEDHRTTFVNSRMVEMLGYTPEEMMGRLADPFLFEEDIEDHHRQMANRRAGLGGQYERRWRRVDGTAVTTIVSAAAMKDSQNRFCGSFAMFLDITERKQAEEALRESEERFKTLFEKSAEAQLLLDGTGTVAECNAAFLTLFALPDNQAILGHSPDDFAPELQPDGIRSSERGDEIMATVVKDGMVRYEWAHQKHDPAQTPILTDVICTLIQIAGQPMIHVSIRDITDRKKAEEALREREETLSSIFRAAPIGIGMVSDRVLMRVNDRLCEMTGYSAGELIGKSARILYPDDEEFESAGREKYEQIRKYGIGTVETRWQRKDGDIRDILLSSTPLDPENHGIGVTFTALDITERKRAEDTLNESKDRFRRLLSSSFDAVVVHQDGRVVLANDAATRIMGVASTAELVGRPVLDLVHPEFRANVAERLQLMLQSPEGTAPLIEEKFVRSDGTFVDVEVMATVTQHEGQPAVMVVFRDISGRKETEAELLSTYQNLTATEEELRQQYEELAQNEEKLRVSEEKFRTLVETTSDFIWEVDESGTYTYVSPQVRELLGYEPEEFIGKTPFDFMQPDEARQVAAEFTRLVGSRLPISSLENSCIHKNGSIVVLETSGIPRLAKDGSFAGYRGIDRDITRRKHAEEALKESEEKYRTILDTTSEWIWDLGLDGRHTYSNNAVESLLGYTVDEFLGFHAFDLMHPEDKKQVEKIFTASIKERKGWRNLVTRWQHKDGTYRYLESNATTIVNERGELTGFRGADRDITDRKLAEEAIRNSEAALREKSAMLEALFNAIPDVIGVQDLHHGIIRYNAAGYAMVGKNPGEVAGKRCYELIGHDTPCEICATSETYRSKKPAMVQKYVPEIDAWLDVRSYPVLDDSGDIQFIIEHLRDISGQKRAEVNYRTLVENSPSVIYTLRPDGILTFISPSWTALLGHEPSEVIDHNFRSFVHRDDIPACEEFLQKTIETGTTQPALEFRVFHKDGATRWYRSTITPVLDDRNALVSFVGNAVDITEQRGMENAFREANHKLNLLNSMTRHDVANQLTILQGYAQIAAMKKGDPVIADYLAKITTAAETIARQIEFTRTYQELGVKAPAWIPLEGVIAHVQSRVPVTFSGTCKGVEIFADPMLGRVFFNLIDNAVRHGGRVTRITIRCEREPDGILVIVEDNGHGIPAAEKERIFERGVGKNTGLGLFLVKEILSITGITIKETGVYGKGARFEINVPERKYRFVTLQ